MFFNVKYKNYRKTGEKKYFKSINEASFILGISNTSISNQLHSRSRKSYSKKTNKYLIFKFI